MSYEKNIGALLFGALAGFGIGILFAPQKGSETRRKIARNTAAAKDNISSEAVYLKDALLSKTQDLRDTLTGSISDNKKSFDERLIALLSEANFKTEDVIHKLEKHLETLKKNKKKFRGGKSA
ncbi:YtxH domain-containing protein [Robertkochia flava]|uniref:YtxH domain-containing protein n=1 Tax=Robertkochia flava TaxID=3447986 RepID=UPI001CCA264F|nr:YtxH domain-containing protein [Robertkochia marina]